LDLSQGTNFNILRGLLRLETLSWQSNQSHDVGIFYDKVVERLLHYVFAKLPDGLKSAKESMNNSEFLPLAQTLIKQLKTLSENA
jgi:hypothetical protein